MIITLGMVTGQVVTHLELSNYLWHRWGPGQIRPSDIASCSQRPEGKRRVRGQQEEVRLHSCKAPLTSATVLPSAWWPSPAPSSERPVWKPSPGLLFSGSGEMSPPWWIKCRWICYWTFPLRAAVGQFVQKEYPSADVVMRTYAGVDLISSIAVVTQVVWVSQSSVHLPGDETGPRQVREGVDHGDHQRNDDDAGVHNVQLGAEINSEPETKKVGEDKGHLQKFLGRNYNRHNTMRNGDMQRSALRILSSMEQKSKTCFHISCPASSLRLPVWRISTLGLCWRGALGMFTSPFQGTASAHTHYKWSRLTAFGCTPLNWSWILSLSLSSEQIINPRVSRGLEELHGGTFSSLLWRFYCTGMQKKIIKK